MVRSDDVVDPRSLRPPRLLIEFLLKNLCGVPAHFVQLRVSFRNVVLPSG